MDTRKLSDLIRQYKYGKLNILNNGMQIIYNLKTEQVKLDPFYHYDSLTARGSCGELMCTAYLYIRERHPEFHVTRVTGNDPNFFRDSETKHCFLFVSEQDLMKGKHYTHEPKDIEEVVSQNPLVVDPSFQRVVPLFGSGYKVQRLMNQGCKVSYGNDIVLTHDQGVSLVFNSREELIWVMINFDSPQLFDIGVQKPRGNILQYGLDSKELDQLLRDDTEILKFIDLLKRRKKSTTRQSFKENNNIIVE